MSVQHLNLLILTSQADEAERIVTALRNGGLGVRAIYTHHPERMAELVAAHSCDMVLCCVYDPSIELEAALTHHRKFKGDVPMVVVAGGETDSDSLIKALRGGARDLVEQGDMQHLLLVLLREYQDLQRRLRLADVEERLRRCEQRSQELVEASSEPVAFIQEGVHLRANPAYLKIFGFDTHDEIDGYPLLDLTTPQTRAKVRDSLRVVESGNDNKQHEVLAACVRADRTTFGAKLVLSRAEMDGEQCLRLAIHAEQVQAPTPPPAPPPQPSARLEGVDADTGLPDRPTFLKRLAQHLAISKRNGPPTAVFYVGIEKFDQLSKSVGVSNALEIAAGVGAALKRLSPEESILARASDSGFLLLLPGLAAQDAYRLASQMRDRIELPISQPPNTPDRPAVRAGVKMLEPGQDTAAGVLDAAYADAFAEDGGSSKAGAGQAGAVAHGSFDEDLTPNKPTDLGFVRRIEQALDNDGFTLVYQPIVSLMGDGQEYYSVLLRMANEDGTLVDAKEIIGPATNAGFMPNIDRWVVREGVQRLSEHRRGRHKINFFLSLNGETLHDERLLIWICDCLREFEARGSWVTFQVVEDQARRHLDQLAKLADGLKKIKCRLAVNHFGIMDNPQTLLEALPLDFVKFDPSFAHGLADDTKKQQQLLDLANLAHQNNAKTIVSGVEDARSLTVLWTAGIDYVQGNFLQRPSATIENVS